MNIFANNLHGLPEDWPNSFLMTNGAQKAFVVELKNGEYEAEEEEKYFFFVNSRLERFHFVTDFTHLNFVKELFINGKIYIIFQ